MNLIKKLPRLLWLNILWLLTSLPLITMGISTCAAYAVTLRIADDDEEVAGFAGIARRFFKAFGQDLGQGFLIFIFSAVGFGLGGLFIYLAYDSGFNLIKVGAIAVYFLVVLVLNFYSYPLIARYSNTFLNTIRNSVALFAQYVNTSIKTLGLVLLELVILALTYKLYLCGLIIIPSVIFYTISVAAKDMFVRLENPVEEEAPEPETGDESETVEGLTETSESQE